ncbi:hypothetical protein RvY_15381 [Ramazzottius varieornatus]|uniref:3-hydroxyisobutyryl-CoA hydrolase, mitochondrial n=1 Tax=Ramazzottius varieornatus TaxID=947166 RepID=A0A1D1W1I8_RAMVA|nr:hypothetical protein RvY_15381 [Ramazzottius varieornatus]
MRTKMANMSVLRIVASLLQKRASCSAVQVARASSISSTPSDDVRFEKNAGVGIITLNKPRALNALTHSMVIAMHNRIQGWERDQTKLIICKGTGDKAFCAGGDVVEIYRQGKQPEGATGNDFFADEYRLNNRIHNLKIPYVALIHGITMGGGVGISVHGKYRVATEKSMFAMPETAIGLIADVGGSYFLPKLKNHLGTYLALTGNRLTGVDVKIAGIATHFVDSSQIRQLESDLISVGYPSDNDVKSILELYDKAGELQRNAKFSLADNLSKIDSIFGKATVEEILDALKEDGSEWTQKLLETLSKMSPTSLKLVMKQLQLGKKKSLAECLNMEYRVVSRLRQTDSDFFEGVRAKLVEKDNSPKWNPSRLEDVSDSLVDNYFAPFEDSFQELKLE